MGYDENTGLPGHSVPGAGARVPGDSVDVRGGLFAGMTGMWAALL